MEQAFPCSLSPAIPVSGVEPQRKCHCHNKLHQQGEANGSTDNPRNLAHVHAAAFNAGTGTSVKTEPSRNEKAKE